LREGGGRRKEGEGRREKAGGRKEKEAKYRLPSMMRLERKGGRNKREESENVKKGRRKREGEGGEIIIFWLGNVLYCKTVIY
jgi:hypothetical protein